MTELLANSPDFPNEQELREWAKESARAMRLYGWDVQFSFGVDGDPQKDSYSVARPVSRDLKPEELPELARKIGITDTDDFLPGYNLTLRPKESEIEGASPYTTPTVIIPAGQEICLTFRGKFTADTVKAVEKLKVEFSPKPGKFSRLINRLVKKN